MAGNYVVVRSFLKSAATFISGAMGSALSFPGFNGECLDPNTGQSESKSNVFMYFFLARCPQRVKKRPCFLLAGLNKLCYCLIV